MTLGLLFTDVVRVPRQSFVANSVEMHRDLLVLGDVVRPKMETKNTWCVFFVKLTSMYGMGQSEG